MDNRDSRRYFYLQYPLDYRKDDDIRRMEHKLGPAAPMVFLELNALAASSGFTIRHREDEESFAEQVGFDLSYPSGMVESVLSFCVKRGMVLEQDGGEAYFFPWAERMTASRTEGAARKARQRQREAGTNTGTMSHEDRDNVPDDDLPHQPRDNVPPGPGQLWDTPGTSTGTILGQCPTKTGTMSQGSGKMSRENIELEIELREERKSRENRELELENIEDGKDTDGVYMTLMEEDSVYIYKGEGEENLTNGANDAGIPIPGLPLPDGTEWSPQGEGLRTFQLAFPALSLFREFANMRSWLEGHPGRLANDSPERFAWSWLNRSQNQQARYIASGQAEGAKRAEMGAPARSREDDRFDQLIGLIGFSH